MKTKQKVKIFLSSLQLEETLESIFHSTLPENWEAFVDLRPLKDYETPIGSMTEEEKKILFSWSQEKKESKKNLLLSLLFSEIFFRLEVEAGTFISLKAEGSIAVVDLELYGKACIERRE